jgi:hypothetical protein
MLDEVWNWKVACEPPETITELVKDNAEQQALFF